MKFVLGNYIKNFYLVGELNISWEELSWDDDQIIGYSGDSFPSKYPHHPNRENP